ncbi:MAG: DNA mismatch repair protein MutS [Clostridia bacterium]|nr:DNA mismatch repair protein MutS [Clostridia bacterium]
MGYTPMIQQYLKIKEQYRDEIVFFRLGDFYEMFFDDAIKASEILEIALTARDGGLGKVPMCGIPYHAYEGYVAKLLARGIKVAICEQVEDPSQAKGIVRREVIRVITPGTVMDEKVLKDNNNNYLVSLTVEKGSWGLAYVDVSTGEFKVTQSSAGINSLGEELFRLKPTEAIIPVELKEEGTLLEYLKQIGCSFNLRTLPAKAQTEILSGLVGDTGNQITLEQQIYHWPLAAMAAYLIVDFLQETQKQKLSHLTRIEVYRPDKFMLLDTATRRNLELTENLHTRGVRGSLLGVLDATITAMGARKLKQWLQAPLIDKEAIDARLGAVEELVRSASLREGLRNAIKGIYDLERLLGRVSYGTANARDLIALKQSAQRLPLIAEVLQKAGAKQLSIYRYKLDLLEDVCSLLEESIVEEPPAGIRDGNIIKDGFHREVDELRRASRYGKQWIAQLEAQERERTGIRSLKVGFNKVFGYYLEVTRANLSLVPSDYQRKQTLANAERFITAELKEKETLILGAEEKLNNLEYRLFQEIRQKIEGTAGRIQMTANTIAELDVLLSFALVAIKNNYCKPELSQNTELELLEARHPVVEELTAGEFVANDFSLAPPGHVLNIITGPNMAGKSTYIRTAALIVIMAQIGSFVPAQKAVIGIVDRVFARVGASDDLSTGQSTFMVEMNEVANILHNATHRSLVILDEVGRGTSTFDGISIAWAVSEYLVDQVKCRTLFATHYHELIALQRERTTVQNFCMAVKEEGNRITFLRRVVPGGADRSYGIHVAELAGLPKEVINKAYEILGTLEDVKGNPSDHQVVIPATPSNNVQPQSLDPVKAFLDRLLNIDLNQVTPIESWHLLFSLSTEADSLRQALQGGQHGQ